MRNADKINFMRYFLQIFVISVALAGCSKDTKERHGHLPKRPNIVVILTDQERYPAHWPEGWHEKNLVAMNRLKKHGMTFHKAYTAACECSPSRAVLISSEFSGINQIPTTPTKRNLPSEKELMDIGALLSERADYDVAWKGKWHLSHALNGGRNWTEADIANLQEQYGLSGWNPPDAGNALSDHDKGLTTLGGGYADNDSRYIKGVTPGNTKQTQGFGESIIDYLEKASKSDKPFCLFISLVNPHDVWVYPTDLEASGYKKEDFIHLNIDLPKNYADDLLTKPSVQLKAKQAYDQASPLPDKQSEEEYVKFYAYLNKKIDDQINTILDTLDHLKLTDKTLIIRTADHGELGLSHGMREKSYTVYEEMIHIPLVISNPKLFPHPHSTDAFYSHLDLMPTLAELAGMVNFTHYGKGVSIVPILKNPHTTVQDSILFAYDDVFMLPQNVSAGHIRAIREGDLTYAVYFSEDGSSFEYELYDLKNDPGQLHNLLFQNTSPEIQKEALRLHRKLKEKIDITNALPANFPWPAL